MKKTKRLFVVVLAVVLTLTGMSMNVFAAGGVSLTGNYYDVGANGKVSGTGTANPNVKIEDAESNTYINMSKTAKPTSNENEFEITLNVETMENLQEIETSEPVSVVLVLDVSDSMDWMLNSSQPGETDWKLDGTRWTFLKETAMTFIKELLLANPENQVSIVVYGGGDKNYNTQFDDKVHATICDWTNSYDSAVESFDYPVVGVNSVYYAVGYTNANLSLRYNVSKTYFAKTDNSRIYGSTNCQAGFVGTSEELGKDSSDNDQYVIFMSDGRANISYTTPEGTSSQAANDAIKEAKALKASYPDSTIYTVGFSDDALDSTVLQKSTDNGADGKNPAVDEYYHAGDADQLKIAYETILSKVYTASEAWTVTDPLPDYVTLKNNSISDPDNAKYDAISRTITWDLVNSTPTKKTEGNKTAYTYTLTYTVTVDATGMNEGEIYPLNKQTTLSHTFTNPDTGMFGAEETANFLVPTVTMGQPVQTQAYTVIYDANGGKGSHTDADLASGSNYAVKQLSGTGIARDGYSFKGWNTKADGSGKLYAPGDTITITENMKLYAQWEQTGSGLSTPKTGDTSNMVLWIILLFVSLSGAVMMLFVNKRKQYKS